MDNSLIEHFPYSQFEVSEPTFQERSSISPVSISDQVLQVTSPWQYSMINDSGISVKTTVIRDSKGIFQVFHPKDATSILEKSLSNCQEYQPLGQLIYPQFSINDDCIQGILIKNTKK